MKFLDHVLQKWRRAKTLKYIPEGSRLLDIGCLDGGYFSYAGKHIRDGLGIDPLLNDMSNKNVRDGITLVKGFFPRDIPMETKRFDIITALAVFEHIPIDLLQDFVTACYLLLNEKGLVILTVPSPLVDKILIILSRLRLVDGMSLEEHHELSINGIKNLFIENGFDLLIHSTFQLGLNNLFVFQK